MDQKISQFIFSAFQDAFEFMRPQLSHYQNFSLELSRQIKIKEDDNIQYSFDIALDNIIKNNIKKYNISGQIFSEESGFSECGDKLYRVIYDPFCNSSLASRTFHEAAIGISIFSYDYEFITSAIMDFQTGIIGIVEDGSTHFYQVQSGEEIVFAHIKNEKIKDSWIVVTLENREERREMGRFAEILKEAKRVIVSSGHIYWLKLASGFIDAYIDPIGGEKLYEMFACTVAQKNGCVVSDLSGKYFDPVEYLKIFQNNQEYVYYPVAATNDVLHRELLSNINK